MRKIRNHIYLENKFVGFHLGMVATSEGSLLIDCPLKVEEAKEWLSLAGEYAKPRYMVLLDAHPDRVLGARSLDLPIIAQDRTLEMIREWSELVEALCESESNWDSIVERDMKRQGKSANRGDYPSLKKLREAFDVSVNIRPFSVSQTMLCDIFSNAAENIQSEAENRAKEITDNLLKANFEKIQKPLKELVSAMDGTKEYFKDSTVHEIEEMVALMRGFNVTNNPQVNEILDDVSNKLFGLDPKQLRKDQESRKEVANTAQEIVNKLESYF